jgi:hypothetical protein
MGKKLENLKWEPRWVSHLGCIKGCLNYLNLDVSDAWLFGATGHAFIINIHDVVCPSGPTAWNMEMLFKLGKNIGYTTEGVFGKKPEGDFAKKQKLAWEKTKQAIDEGLPCYGWELDIPEYYVVYGYDDKGYYYSGAFCDSSKGPKPWQELGDTQIGVLEMYTVKPNQPAGDSKTVKEALKFALEHSKGPANWIYPKYKAGLAGYGNWIRALETGRADGLGVAYNAAVWAECRGFAVQFLKEAKKRIGGKFGSLFDTAASNYETVAQNLKKVSDTFPFQGPNVEHVMDEASSRIAAEYLRVARNAEQAGLSALEKILMTFDAVFA